MSVTRKSLAAPSRDASGTVASDEAASVIAEAKNAHGIIVFGYAIKKMPLCADLIMTSDADTKKISDDEPRGARRAPLPRGAARAR